MADNVIEHTLLEGQTMIMLSVYVFAEVLVIYIKKLFFTVLPRTLCPCLYTKNGQWTHCGYISQYGVFITDIISSLSFS